MKKLFVILITVALLVGVVAAFLVTAQNDQTASNAQYASNYKSHGTGGNGNVHQKFLGGFEDPWDCPPQHGEICIP